MIYVKHPEYGNKHIGAEEVEAHAANGWVVWPRPAHVKSGIIAPPEPVKRGPGRPKKVSK